MKDRENGQGIYCYRNNHFDDCRIKIRYEKERSKFSRKSKPNKENFSLRCLVRGQTDQNGSSSQVLTCLKEVY